MCATVLKSLKYMISRYHVRDRLLFLTVTLLRSITPTYSYVMRPLTQHFYLGIYVMNET